MLTLHLPKLIRIDIGRNSTELLSVTKFIGFIGNIEPISDASLKQCNS